MNTPKVIRVEEDEGYSLDKRPFEMGELAILSLPCPARGIGGRAGGMVMTTCVFCGETMASTAGPHGRNSRWHKPVICYESDGSVGVSWTDFYEGYNGSGVSR